ncbi:MAG TPA: DUF1772 domain-containing protein [Casimicrobiaceae bacterium]|nr:DUF1772 domain-containing protein [Casimicrobiaceae bacterium]
MQVGWLRILSVLFAALALVFSGAHLFELSHKIGLSAADYLTVQQLYRGWQFAGIIVVAAVVSIAWLAYAVRHDRRAFVPTIIALLCILGTQILFWTFNFPANRATDNWATLPADWEMLRQRWEFAHVASALLNLGALIVLLEALLGPARESTSSNTASARAMQPRRRLELQEVER